MSAKYKSPSFLLPNELNTSANPANDTGINSLYSMDFAANRYIDTGDAFTSLTSFSVSAWFKSDNTAASAQAIVSSRINSIATSQGLDLNISVNAIYVRVFNNGATEVTTSFTDTTSWHHIVMTYNGTTLEMYLDGVSQGTATGVYTNSAANWLIGKWNAGSNYFDGKIDEVAIFNRALNTTEIAALYGGTSPNIYPSNLMATDLGPIAYYPLGEQAQNTGYLDPSNPGSDIAGSEWQFPNGVLQDYVMDFDSASPGDYISVPMTMLNSATQCTISFWGKKDASNKILCIGDQITNSSGIWVMWYSDGNIYFSPRGSGAGSFSLSYTQPYDNNWHHYLAVYNGSSATNCKLYLDGDLVATGSGTAPSSLPAATGNAFKIGALISSSFYSDGQISNVAVWNTAITDANQIANIYNNGSPQTTYTVTPQNWWKLNADSVYTPSVASYSAALDFGGTDYVDCGVVSAVENVSSFSMSVWVYPSNGNLKSVIGNWGNPYVGVEIGTSSGAVYFTVDSDTVGSGYGATPSGLSNNNWAHLVLVFDGSGSGNSGRLKGYINGVEQTLSYTGTIPATTAAPNRAFRIGDQHVGNGLIGNISNAAIFDSALTSTQVSTLFNFGTPETNISFSPISWWKLDNLTTGILDSGSASNNGTNNGATDATTSVAVVPSWKIPSALTIPTINYTTALDFDGNTNYVTAGTTSYLNNVTEMSLSIWFNLDIAAENKGIVDDQDKHLAIYTKTVSGSDYSLRINLNGSANRFQLTGAPFTAGKWHNLLMTFNAGTLNFYIDGNTTSHSFGVYSGSIPSSLANNTGTLDIGRYSTLEWDGLISNAQIWTTELSSSDALSIYNNGQPSTTAFGSPVSWWKLDSTTITDSVGSNNGTNNGATQVTSDVYSGNIPVNGVSTTLPSTALQQSDLQFDSPYSNYSLNFNGSGDYIDCTNSSVLDITGSITLSCWMKSSNTGANRKLLTKDDVSTRSFQMNTNHASLGPYTYFWLGGGVLKSVSTGTPDQIVDGNWHHVVSVFKSGEYIRIYIDGVQAGNTNVTETTLDSSTANFLIGSNGWSGTAGIDGNVDEVAIWNSALTQAEILQIYNNGRPKDLTTFSGTAPISWWRLGENAYFDNNAITVPNSISGAPNGVGPGTVVNMLSADAPGTYANGIGTNLDILDRVGDAPLSTSNSQSYNMIPDDKIPYVPKYVGKQIANNFSMAFDGTNYINAGRVLGAENTSALSVSFWLKISSIGAKSYLGYFIGNFGAGWLVEANASSIFFALGDTGTGYQSFTLPYSGNININTWYSIVMVFDGTQTGSSNILKVYINGTQKTLSGSPSFPSSIPTLSGAEFTIGGINPTNVSGAKNIDEVAIFDKALNAGQIYNDIYQPTSTATNKTADLVNNPNLPNPVAWYRMGD